MVYAKWAPLLFLCLALGRSSPEQANFEAAARVEMAETALAQDPCSSLIRQVAFLPWLWAIPGSAVCGEELPSLRPVVPRLLCPRFLWFSLSEAAGEQRSCPLRSGATLNWVPSFAPSTGFSVLLGRFQN